MSWVSDRKRGNRHKRGYGHSWDKLRAVILSRDSHCCVMCDALGRTTPANTVDHITPKSLGGSDRPDNLQSLCQDCHAFKTARETKARPGKECNIDGQPLDRSHHWNKQSLS